MYSVREESSAMVDVPHVQGRTLSRIIQDSGFGTVDLIKIDVEGAERELFQGDLSWLERTRAIAIEFHGDSRRTCQFDEIVKRFEFHVHEHPHTILAVREYK